MTCEGMFRCCPSIITHMEQSPLCNHAFGMQFLSNEGFRPTGFRLTDGGIAVVKHCYENKIMIDIKHLSLGSRQHLYQLRTTPDFTGINQPIVCTHAGFTGISVTEIPRITFLQCAASMQKAIRCCGRASQ